MPIGVTIEINHFLSFKGDSVPGGFQNKFFKVINVEPFEYESGRTDTAEFNATVAFGGNSGFRNFEVLEPNEKHLYSLDWGVKDGCRYYLKIPSGSDRLGLDEDMDVGFVDNKRSPWIVPDPRFGFWLVDNMYPAFDAYNDCPKTLTPKIWFQGVKYEIEEVSAPDLIARLNAFKEGRGGQPFKSIPLGGVAV